ncbi:hypothetical protein ACVW07_001289 [Cellulomonas sp. URHB0016]
MPPAAGGPVPGRCAAPRGRCARAVGARPRRAATEPARSAAGALSAAERDAHGRERTGPAGGVRGRPASTCRRLAVGGPGATESLSGGAGAGDGRDVDPQGVEDGGDRARHGIRAVVLSRPEQPDDAAVLVHDGGTGVALAGERLRSLVGLDADLVVERAPSGAAPEVHRGRVVGRDHPADAQPRGPAVLAHHAVLDGRGGAGHGADPDDARYPRGAGGEGDDRGVDLVRQDAADERADPVAVGGTAVSEPRLDPGAADVLQAVARSDVPVGEAERAAAEAVRDDHTERPVHRAPLGVSVDGDRDGVGRADAHATGERSHPAAQHVGRVGRRGGGAQQADAVLHHVGRDAVDRGGDPVLLGDVTVGELALDVHDDRLPAGGAAVGPLLPDVHPDHAGARDESVLDVALGRADLLAREVLRRAVLLGHVECLLGSSCRSDGRAVEPGRAPVPPTAFRRPPRSGRTKSRDGQERPGPAQIHGSGGILRFHVSGAGRGAPDHRSRRSGITRGRVGTSSWTCARRVVRPSCRGCPGRLL